MLIVYGFSKKVKTLLYSVDDGVCNLRRQSGMQYVTQDTVISGRKISWKVSSRCALGMTEFRLVINNVKLLGPSRIICYYDSKKE